MFHDIQLYTIPKKKISMTSKGRCFTHIYKKSDSAQKYDIWDCKIKNSDILVHWEINILDEHSGLSTIITISIVV